MSQLVIRPTTVEDAAAIAAVCNALALKLHGEADVSEEHIAHWFGLPELAFWGAELDGRLVGHLDVQHEREANRFEADARVHPVAWGEGVADALLETAEAWAGERASPGAVLRAYADAPEEEQRDALGRRGYVFVRHFFRMGIDLDGLVAEPDWPVGMTVRPFEAADEQRVYDAHLEAFADHWGFRPIGIEEWRHHMLDNPRYEPELWKLVEDGDELAGFSINSWHSSGDPTYGWISVLGVRSAWRRRGLGDALLRSSFAVLQRRGATRVGLGVDAENTTGAVALYERAGMSPTRRQDVYELRL
jgi:mycothiol synthase